MRAAAALLLLAACSREQPTGADTPGARLEAAATARGLLPDGGSATGIWASDSDRLCIVPEGGASQIGAVVDYGEGQGCTAAGTAERKGDDLRVSFGDCRFSAAVDGERISFPAELPPACTRLCTGRASLTALTVTRLSASASEAAALRGGDGRLLCGS